MLPWFQNRFPIYLAPMAGVTDSVFRGLCKEYGADVMVTEFVSAEGIFRKNARTMEYLDFDEVERPLGVQLFGGDPDHLGEAAKIVLDWKRPDFLDINFGCPVNKVVSKNGGSALLRDCPLLEKVASAVVRAAAPHPVTAKIRLGWSQDTINATTISRILEGVGIQAIAVHGRTKDQGYSGAANWDEIAAVAASVSIPVIGNGDITCAADVEARRSSGVRGVMVGRAAMTAPWIFRQIRALLDGEPVPADLQVEDRWQHIRRHCLLAIAKSGSEAHTISSMRSRLMAYSRGMPEARNLRLRFAHVTTVAELDEIAAENIERARNAEPEPLLA